MKGESKSALAQKRRKKSVIVVINGGVANVSHLRGEQTHSKASRTSVVCDNSKHKGKRLCSAVMNASTDLRILLS